MAVVIRVESLKKTFGHKQALADLVLTMEPGEMVALIGVSAFTSPSCSVLAAGGASFAASMCGNCGRCWRAGQRL